MRRTLLAVPVLGAGLLFPAAAPALAVTDLASTQTVSVQQAAAKVKVTKVNVQYEKGRKQGLKDGASYGTDYAEAECNDEAETVNVDDYYEPGTNANYKKGYQPAFSKAYTKAYNAVDCDIEEEVDPDAEDI